MVKIHHKDPLIFVLGTDDLMTNQLANRIDVRYYDPGHIGLLSKIRGNRFEVRKLAEIAKVTRILGFEAEKLVEYVEDGVPYLRVQNVKEFEIDLSNVKHIPWKAHIALKRSQLKPKDVVLTITGRVGTVAVVPDNLGECNASQEIVKIRVDKTKINPYYVAFYLHSEIGRRLLEIWQTGSTRPRTLIQNVRKILVVVPPMNIQKELVLRIERLMRTKKKKLAESEKNREKSRQIMKKKYDPVYKILGIIKSKPREDKVFILNWSKINQPKRFDVRYYKTKDEMKLGAMYPARKIRDIFNISGETIILQNEPNKKFKYISIGDVDGDSGVIISYSEILGGDAPSRARMILHEGDIITGISGSATGTPKHSTAIVTREYANCIASTGFAVLRPKKGIDRLFIYHMLRSEYILNEIKQRLSGATIPAITKSELGDIEVPIPDIKIQRKIVRIISETQKKAKKYKENAMKFKGEADKIKTRIDNKMRATLFST